jgi:hypothetical protein
MNLLDILVLMNFFSGKLRVECYFGRKNVLYRRYKKMGSETVCTKYPYHHRLVI